MKDQVSPKRVIGFLFGLWRISPIAMISMIITQIIFAIISSTIAPIFLSQLLTHVADGSATMNNSVWLLVGYALILILGEVIIVRITIAMAYIGETKIQATVLARILKHLTDKSLGYHANKMSGGIVSDSNKLNNSIENFWDTLCFTAVPIITTIISVCIALSFIYWQYAIALAILSIIVISVIIKTQSTVAPLSKLVAEKSSAMTAYFADVIGNIATVKAFSGAKAELKQYKKITSVWSDTNFKQMKSVLILSGSFGTMMAIMNICAFIAAILATEYHIASVGVIYLVISYTMSVVGQLWSVSKTIRTYLNIIGNSSPMIATLDEDIELKDPIKPEKSKINDGKIMLNNVTFTHEENSKPLFKSFNLTVEPGERIGLVGRSGSGKTSLTRLLLRFSDIDNGQISIDGQDITKITQDDLRKSIAFVSQEPILFHRTLRENIAYGKPGSSEKEIVDAAKRANAYEFIKTLPNGFDTIVGERGIKLSGGQRQRVAIARAILKNAPILVLDEATSALDSESEKLIQDALAKLMKGKTSIVIAHRLSTIAKLDRIVVLDNGKIVEQGTHSGLLKAQGIYSKLWNHQSGGFLEEK